MLQRGKLYILSYNELISPRTQGQRLRAMCPVHGGDKQRSLSIALDCEEIHATHNKDCNVGLGRCHSCNATVFVAEYNPLKAASLGYQVQGNELQAIVRDAQGKDDTWGRKVQEQLQAIYGRTKLALRKDRPRAYLAQRGIDFDLAESYGLGYIPTLADTRNMTNEQVKLLGKWFDRIIFPAGNGFIGRTLFLWEDGMTEDEHKKAIDKHNAMLQQTNKPPINRYEKTSQVGLFGFEFASECNKLALVEGQFDALACLSVGIPTIAMGQWKMNPDLLPMSVHDVVVGLDTDKVNSVEAREFVRSLRKRGIGVQVAVPQIGKDWSEAYRLAQWEGMTPLLSCFEEEEDDEPMVEEGEHTMQPPCSIDEVPVKIYGKQPEPQPPSYKQTILSKIGAIIPCTITDIDDIAAYKRARIQDLRPPYTPCTLDPLPRRQCPHHMYTSTWKRTKCQGKTLEHGWCEMHQGSHLLLELGAKLGYPEANYSQHSFIPSGLVQWECFAEGANERTLRHALVFLKKMLDMEVSR